MRVVIAIDKFKGTLTARQAADAIAEGLQDASGGRMALEIERVPMADGGDGSMATIRRYLSAQEVECRAHNPLGREIPASYLLYREAPEGPLCAFIEMARVSGLVLLEESERNPLQTSSVGLGELILDASRRGAREIYVSIGGSATNDAGTGMLQALGYTFPDASGSPLEPMCGAALEQVAAILPPQGESPLQGAHINVICDVTNPLLGPYGATMVYAPQKGADAAMLERLERGMAHFASIAEAAGADSAFAERPGAGAAGGVGYALAALLGAEMISGWNFFAKITGLREKIAWADLVISGEGKIDSQSFCGKVVDGVVQIARSYDKPVLLFCGVAELEGIGSALGVKRENDMHIYSLNMIEPDLKICMEDAGGVLRDLVRIAVRYSGIYREY